MKKKEVTYEQIENLAKEIKNFIKEKGFDIFYEEELIVSLQEVINDSIDHHFD